MYFHMLKKKSCALLAVLMVPSCGMLFGQDSSAVTTATVPANKPVTHTFENPVVVNNQTVEGLPAQSLDFNIQHRFGVIENEEDLFGLYAPSNIRLALTYGFTDRLSVGLGATKFKHIYDLNWKYVLLRQTKPSGMPVTVTYFGDVACSGADESGFLNQDGEYKVSNRYTYFHELMIARKINSRLSLQAAGTFSYMNLVDSSMVEHAYFGISFVGRYQFSPQSSVIFDFDLPLTTYDGFVLDEESGAYVSKELPIYSFGIGYEVATSSHTFQLIFGSASAIINQENRVYNQFDFFKGDIAFGFNITRQWGF